ncbi:leucine-rich repeat protein [Artemisia annua]|uniref:Leucine-rich repeat protein n=1 Tax=Artemisia annua TaxID=35608 RepID=A0A2U1NE34_ARTAN|nr:leucine-rich repeat protein [Artemisia annua]
MALLTFPPSAFCIWFLLICSLCTFCFCKQNQDNVLCKANERLALIQFKNNLIDRTNRLSSWSGNDCCSWSGVVCDDGTGHVLEIRLRGPDDGLKGRCHGSYDTDDELEEASKHMLGGNISSSLIKLVQLRYLDLSCNDFKLIPVPAFIGSLKNLTYLNMSKSQFGGEVPQNLGNLSMLRVLALQDDMVFSNLHSNNLRWLRNLTQLQHLNMVGINLTEASDWLQIVEEIPKSLPNLCNLTTLDFNSNYFFGNVSELLERFCECESPKMELLAMRGNDLIGRLPRKLGRLKNLSSIDLAYNNLTGTIPDSVGSLSLLVTLQINVNKFEGSIPDTIGGLSSLVLLDLSFNKLNGSLPESIGQLGKLSFLTLHHNFLTGIVTENHFAKLTALGTLWIGDNILVFKLNANNWVPPFQLSVLRIGSCSLGPNFPSWVQSQTMLNELDLANANISDIIPHWFWTTFSTVTYLNISNNNIQGKLGDVSFLVQYAIVDLSSNHFNGLLPRNLNKPNLRFLDLSHNNISGSLGQFLCSEIQEPQSLEVLNMGYNNMSGVIPDCWMNWDYLVILNLEHNKVSGIIPSSLGKISSLKSLHMCNNKLSGNLPVSVLNSKSLVNVELAENGLTGRIPASIKGNSSSLKLLSLRSNHLEGKIPDEICRLTSIQILDLSLNDLFGNIPTCFTNFSVISGRLSPSPTVLYKIDYFNDVPQSVSLWIKGQMALYSTILYLVTTIDLSNNNLFGPIPNELGTLRGLRYLNLSRNDLSSSIPETIGEMGILETLDLSMNRLNGKIPIRLSRLASISLLNVSYNNLIGRIPTSTQLQSMSEYNFIGNALCGAPLSSCQQTSVDAEDTNSKSDESDGFDWILVICAVGGLIVGFWIIIATLFVSKQWRTAYYRYLDTTWINIISFFSLFTTWWAHRIIEAR